VVVGPNGHLLKSDREGNLNLHIQLLQEEFLDIKRSNAELVEALKRMTVNQYMKPSAKAVEVNLSSGPPKTLSLKTRTRKYCDFRKMEGHTKDYRCSKHAEKRPISKVKCILEEVIKKKKKKKRNR
jgi:hypothetical protein